MNLLSELRRRRVFRMAGMYIVGAWVVIEVASVFFPAWNIPDTALRYLFIAAALLFPVAVIFSWMFDITPQGVVRTQVASPDEAAPPIGGSDYLVLAALAAVTLFIIVGSFEQVAEESPQQATFARPPNSIAILPFANLNADDESRTYTDGVSDAILHRMASQGSLRVLARNSSFPFRDSDKGDRTISEILGVRYLLRGSLEQIDDRILIEARLIDDGGFEVWRDTYERPESQVFDIQNSIVLDVARHISGDNQAASSLPGSTTNNPVAYRQYLIGMEYVNKRTPGWQDSAILAFRQVIAEDPAFAPAYAGLAIALFVHNEDTGRVERREQALEMATKGLELQPALADTRAAMGLVLIDGDTTALEEARQHLEMAVNIDPSHANAYNWLASVLGQLGDQAGMERIQDEGLQVDPLNPALVTNVASRAERKGDFDRALKIRKRLLQLPTPPGLAYWGIYLQYYEVDNIAESIYWAKQAAIAYQGTRNQLSFFALAVLYEQLALSSEADYWLDMLDKHHPDPLARMIRRSYFSVLRGDMDTLQTTTEMIAATGVAASGRLPPQIKQRLGALFATAGRLEEGIRLLEDALRVDLPVEERLRSYELAQMTYVLASAYRRLGEDDKAAAMFQRGHDIVGMLRADGLNSDSPSELEMLVYQHILSGDYSSAAIALRNALDAGWTNYYWFYNNPDLGPAVRSPELSSLFDEGLARVEQQRRIVEERDQSDKFKERIAFLMQDSDTAN